MIPSPGDKIRYSAWTRPTADIETDSDPDSFCGAGAGRWTLDAG